MPYEGWKQRFDEPIEVPGGKLVTLADAIAWLAKKVPKSRHRSEEVQRAALHLTRAAEQGWPVMFASIAMRQALHALKPKPPPAPSPPRKRAKKHRIIR